MGRALVVVALVGCGRLGFDETSPPTDGVTPDTPSGAIQITVRFGEGTTDEGSPVEAARIVLPDNTFHLTDATGALTLPVDVATTFHVIHPSQSVAAPGSFRMVTYYDVPPGTAVEVGARPHAGEGGMISVSATPDAGAQDYFLYGPAECGPALDGDPLPAFTWPFNDDCVGRTVELYLVSNNGGVSQSFASTGPIVLANNGVFTFGAYTAASATQALVQNIPLGFDTAALRFANVDNASFYDLGNNLGPISASRMVGGSLLVPVPINYVQAVLRGVAATSTVRIAGALDGASVLDAAAVPALMAPPGAQPALRTLNWGQPSTTAQVMRASVDIVDTQRVLWTIYAPPSRTDATFPDLQGDLAMLVPSPSAAWNSTNANSIDLAVPNPVALLKTVDVDFLDVLAFRTFPKDRVVTLQHATEAP